MNKGVPENLWELEEQGREIDQAIRKWEKEEIIKHGKVKVWDNDGTGEFFTEIKAKGENK